MEKIIYLDNAATTKPFKKSVDDFKTISIKNYYNPSSIHKGGIKSKEIIEKSRKNIASILNVTPEELIFTSSATEANNAIINNIGLSLKNDEYILTSSMEHKSIRESAKKYKTKFLKHNPNGLIKLKDLKNKITKKCKLLSFILTNNETGIIQRYNKIIKIVKDISPDTPIHIDGVQAFGKLLWSIKDLDIDFFTISGHKIHSVKGIGLLYKKKNISFSPYISGGSQENGFRAGTENIGGIKAIATSINILKNNYSFEKIKGLSDFFKSNIEDMKNYILNSINDNLFQANIISLRHKYIPGNVILNYLSNKNIYISTGSACNEKNKKLNPVLKATGLENLKIRNSFRISLSVFNKKDEIKILLKQLAKIDQNYTEYYKKWGNYE